LTINAHSSTSEMILNCDRLSSPSISIISHHIEYRLYKMWRHDKVLPKPHGDTKCSYQNWTSSLRSEVRLSQEPSYYFLVRKLQILKNLKIYL